MARVVSIRRSLLVNLVVVIVLLGAAILTTTIIGARTVVRTLSGSLITRTIDQIEAKLHGFLDPVVVQLGLLRTWHEGGALEPDNAEGMNRLLEPITVEPGQISSLMVADERGREHLILRAGDSWRSRQTRRDEWGDETRWLRWTTAAREPEAYTEALGYDPRNRPWYGPAAADIGTVQWTEPYAFFTTGAPGMTASLAFTGADGRVNVIGADVRLDDVSDFIAGLDVTERGLVFVLAVSSSDGRLKFIGLPEGIWDSEQQRRAALLQAPEDVGITLLTDAADALGTDPTAAPARFESGGQAWWGGSASYPLSPSRRLWIAVLVPEADLLGDLMVMRMSIGGILAVVLLGAILRAAGLARRYSRPLEDLVRQSHRISRGDLEPGPPIESRVAEVHRLADAHDRMREGLQSLMKLERDLQLARQIQQSTFPDRLPALPGFDLHAWTEPAEETGGDTYDVIGLSAPAGADGAGGARLAQDRAERAVLLLADATGHGIGPALSVTQIRAMVRIAVRLRHGLPEIARELNEELCADLPPGRFITAWLGVLDASEETITSFSAGQGPLLLYHAARRHIDVMNADAIPFGIDPGLEIAVAPPIRLEPGDVFAVLSDGIFEATNDASEQFGTDRVLAVIADHHAASAEGIMDALRRAVDTFTATAPAEDDRTALIIKKRSD